MSLVRTLLLGVLLSVGSAAAEVIEIPVDALARQRLDDVPINAFPLHVGWRFRPGHSEAWAARDFDDSSWRQLDSLATSLSTTTREQIGWTGEGWFRLRLHVNDAVSARDIGLLYRNMGALAIYLDGVLLHTSGHPASRREEEVVHLVHGLPEVTPLPLTVGDEHVLALRYTNRSTLGMLSLPDELGFGLSLVELRAWEAAAQRFTYVRIVLQTLFVIPLAFSLFHLLLFLFHRQGLGHLYYALFALSVAVLIYAPLHLIFAHTPLDITIWLLGFKWSLLAAPLTGLLFLYHEFIGRISAVLKIAGVFSLGIAVAALFLPVEFFYWVTMIFLLDVVRVVIIGLRRGTPEAGVVRAGWFLFATGCALQVLVELGMVKPALLTSDPFNFFPYIYGTLILVVSMSVYLARTVARTNQELAIQLEQVRSLSAHAVEHERRVQTAKLTTLTQLVAGIVHELNSPIGAIRSATDTLARAVGKLRSTSPPGPALQAIDSVNTTLVSATDRLGTVLSGFKSFSHLDEAEWQIAPIEQGLDDTLVVMDAQLTGEIIVEREYGGVPAIWCAPARLNQVFIHLITNALQAMGGRGTIRLRTWVEEGTNVCVGIGDSGPGMTPEQVDGLFDVAFRHSARVKMGLGLIADAHTLSEHGGQLQVHSSVGVGTEIVLRLPLRLRE